MIADSKSGVCQKPHWYCHDNRKQWSRVNTSGLGSSSVLFPRANHGSTKIYPRDYKDYAEIESLPSHPARMPKCVSGKLSLNHCVFTRGRYRASDPKLYVSRIAYHHKALVTTRQTGYYSCVINFSRFSETCKFFCPFWTILLTATAYLSKRIKNGKNDIEVNKIS